MQTLANDIPMDVARAAYAGISFSPDKRAESVRDEYASQMASDYADLQKLTVGKEGMQAVLDAEFERYRQGYRARYLKKLYSDSRCMSWMITGPSNFPVRRMDKRNAAAHKRLEETISFRKRALDAIRKTLCPELRPIMSGDDDAQQRLIAKIAEAEEVQANMKLANSTIRKHAKEGKEAQIAALVALGLQPGRAARLIEPDFCGRIGFADYELTNNNANIRRMKERLVVISRNQATPEIKTEGTKARFEDCPPENRVRLFFPGKPDDETRTRLKRGGFRWTPSLGCWQAYRHQHTFDMAKVEAGI